jgi:hypothetical protein
MASALQIVQKFYPEVTKVVNAKHDLNIKLRPADVRSAGVKKHDGCAMAQACKRQLHVDGAIVSTSSAYLIDGKKATRYSVPLNVAKEIIAFDRGAGFEPGEYQLVKPWPSAIKRNTGRVRGRETGEKRFRRKSIRSAHVRTALSAI